MYQAFSYGMGVVLKTAVVFVINVSLFLIIPVTESVFRMFGPEEKSEVVAEHKVIAEYVKPKPKPETKPKQRRIRTVSNANARPLQSTMKLKFAPDLSVGGMGDGVVVESRELQAEVFEEGQVDVEAVPMFTPAPAYPKRARELAVEGEAVAQFVVDVDGKVRQIERIDAPHQVLEEEIRRTLVQWKFKPAQNRGVPVKARMSVPFSFALD
jgi:periplasmic protein TonB